MPDAEFHEGGEWVEGGIESEAIMKVGQAGNDGEVARVIDESKSIETGVVVHRLAGCEVRNDEEGQSDKSEVQQCWQSANAHDLAHDPRQVTAFVVEQAQEKNPTHDEESQG